MSSKKTKTQTAPIRWASESHTGRESFLVLSPKVFGALAIILIATLLCYLPVFDNGFVNWDDDKYIYDNPLIRDLNFKAFFSQYVMGHYHPFVITTYALIYKVFGLNPDAYHGISLLFHLSNTILVFLVFRALSERKEVAFIVSLLFGIHPLHVESVAWASELKDVMYVFFFLMALLQYLLYLRRGLMVRHYLWAVFFFLCSVLSKASGITLVAVLLLTDFYTRRPFTKKVWLEKIPFLAGAVAFGWVSYLAQAQVGATEVIHFPFSQRVVFAAYGYVTYIQKLIFPAGLSAFYPYPIDEGQSMPGIFFLYPLLVILIVGLTAYSLKSNRRMFYGIGFFSITAFLTLQLLPAGTAVMADRYAYLPSLGIFFIMAHIVLYIKTRWNAVIISAAVLAAMALAYSFTTHRQVALWKDSITLWTDVIRQWSQTPLGYKNRGVARMELNDLKGGISDLNQAIALDPNQSDFYNAIGAALEKINNYPEAINNFDKAIQLRPDFQEALYNRGIAKGKMNDHAGAINDFNQAISLNPSDAFSYFNRANAKMLMENYGGAVKDLNAYLKLSPMDATAYMMRGYSKMMMGDWPGACPDLNKAASLGDESAVGFVAEYCR